MVLKGQRKFFNPDGSWEYRFPEDPPTKDPAKQLHTPKRPVQVVTPPLAQNQAKKSRTSSVNKSSAKVITTVDRVDDNEALMNDASRAEIAADELRTANLVRHRLETYESANEEDTDDSEGQAALKVLNKISRQMDVQAKSLTAQTTVMNELLKLIQSQNQHNLRRDPFPPFAQPSNPGRSVSLFPPSNQQVSSTNATPSATSTIASSQTVINTRSATAVSASAKKLGDIMNERREIDEYNGKTSFNEWWAKVRHSQKIYRWTDNVMLEHACARLTGDATVTFEQLGLPLDEITIEIFVKAMRTMSLVDDSPESLQMKLLKMTIDKDERIQAYAARFNRIFNEVPGLFSESMKVTWFLHGLANRFHPPALQAAEEKATYNDALKCLIGVEKYEIQRKQASQLAKNSNIQNNPQTTSSKQSGNSANGKSFYCERHDSHGGHDTAHCFLKFCNNHKWCKHATEECKNLTKRGPPKGKLPWHQVKRLKKKTDAQQKQVTVDDREEVTHEEEFDEMILDDMTKK